MNDLAEAESNLVKATRRSKTMHISDPEFHHLDALILKLKDRVSELRGKQMAEKYGLVEEKQDTVAANTPPPVIRKDAPQPKPKRRPPTPSSPIDKAFDARIEKHHAEAKEALAAYLEACEFEGGEHAVLYSQKRHWQINRMFHMLLMDIGLVNELAKEKREALEARIKVLEARPTPEYKGIWATGTSYAEGSMVTHGGSVWHCNRATTDKPGDGSAAWTLAVKHGKDAR